MEVGKNVQLLVHDIAHKAQSPLTIVMIDVAVNLILIYMFGEQLADDEVIISSNSSILPIESTINLGGKNYKTRIVEGLVPGNFAIEIYKIISKHLL